MITTTAKKSYHDMAPRELREARDLFIVTRLKDTEKEKLRETIEELAEKFKLTSQQVQNIAEKAGIITRRQHSEATKIKERIIEQMGACDPKLRQELAVKLATKTGYSVLSIRNMCLQAGVKMRRGGEVDKWLKVIGDYRRLRSMPKVAENNGVSVQRVSEMLKKARAYGVLEAADSALRHDAEIKKDLEIIDKANRRIEKRLVERSKGR